MANTTGIQYTYISELSDASALSASDLFVVSQLKNAVQNTYESYKLTYSQLSSGIYNEVSNTMSSVTDLAISACVEELSAKIDTLSSKIDICLSACVALDNCRSLFKAAVVQTFLDNGLTNLTALTVLTSDDGQTDQTDNT